MKVFRTLLIMSAFAISCAEKKETEDSIVKATMPDGTEIELNKDRLYAEADCEVDNVLTSTYRKTYYSVNNDQLYVWGLVFLNEACDPEQEHIVFGAPLTWTLKDFDGSKGTLDLDEDQTADYEVTVAEDQLAIHPLFEADYVEDQSFAKTETAFSVDKVFDFTLDVATPTLTSTKLQVDFTIALATDDFLVNGVSYLTSIFADITCKLANNAVVRPKFSTTSTENRLNGAGSYSASAVLSPSQVGVALKSCEVFLERVFEASDNGSSSWEVKSVEITVE